MNNISIKNNRTYFLITYLKLIRMYQWIKNGFIFLPIFFAHQLFYYSSLNNVVLSFFSFSLVASGIYIFNDICDLEHDRRHPSKSLRPIALGLVSTKNAYLVMAIVFSLGLYFGYIVNIPVLLLVSCYLCLNIAYSLSLKKIPLLDICSISTGFVIRLYVGSYAANVPTSNWIVLMTFVLSIFLGIAKRRDDIVQSRKDPTFFRESMKGYNEEFIMASMVMMAGVTVVSYIMYTMSQASNKAIFQLSSLWVIVGVLRYFQVTLVYQKSGNPTKVLIKDNFLKLIVVTWFIFTSYCLYF